MKLERLLAKHQSMGRTRARQAIADKQVIVNGCIATRGDQEVDRFSCVVMGEVSIQQAVRLLHIMVNKPIGVLSATTDVEFTTVVDL
ncbi:MAG: 16S rRNA pseudouridine(516) synthase, partial [Gloeobacteraceae cyanobacterium ES-bin-144]|nr:16S rRNA pseudouridine(516) synthase [Verrucomicrobiales bacterium]